ncbi:MAG TPA: hypothetical protein VFK02_25115 [Kofleriaceae bacterium]|nr:hypothetical protein [Kofleriaceae bacterium]
MNEARPQVTIPDLVAALERFGRKYEAIDVFANDIVELSQWEAARPHPPHIQAVNAEGTVFVVRHGTQSYRLEIFPAEGVARLSRWTGAAPSPVNSAIAGAALGAAIGAATAKKGGDGWIGGLLLGLLMGAAVGGGGNGSTAPHRVFALVFDAAAKDWRPYDGGLLRWMKERLSVQPA